MKRPLKTTKDTRYPVDCDECGRHIGSTDQHYADGRPPPPVFCLHCVASHLMTFAGDAGWNKEGTTT